MNLLITKDQVSMTIPGHLFDDEADLAEFIEALRAEGFEAEVVDDEPEAGS